MVKFDLLLLPLIGGYIFLITSYFTKFYHQRLDRQRLIFNSVIAGVLISIIGLYLNELLVKLMPKWDPCPVLFAGYEQALLRLMGNAVAEQIMNHHAAIVR